MYVGVKLGVCVCVFKVMSCVLKGVAGINIQAVV